VLRTIWCRTSRNSATSRTVAHSILTLETKPEIVNDLDLIVIIGLLSRKYRPSRTNRLRRWGPKRMKVLTPEIGLILPARREASQEAGSVPGPARKSLEQPAPRLAFRPAHSALSLAERLVDLLGV